MQTPLLFTPQTAQKNLIEVANKNESNVNKMNVNSEKTPFQMALDQKVRAKEGDLRPNQAPIQNKRVHATPASEKKVAAEQQAEQPELIDGQLDKQSAKQSAAGQESLSDLTEPRLDSDMAKLPAGVKDEMEIIPVDDANNVMAIMAPTSLASANSNILANPKEITLSLSGASKELASNKQALVLGDAALVDASSDLAGNEAADIHAKIDQVLDHSRWSGGVAGKDVNASKIMLNLAKDTVAKEMIVTSGIQPQVAQAQSQLAAQQVTQPLNSANIINVYPGKSGWDQAISQRVMLMVGAGEQSASLTLNPPDLGPLKVVIHVHNNQADTTFISDNDEVRRALESGLSHLRDKMNETGVQLGQTNINSSSQSQENFQQAAQNRALIQAQAKNNDSPPIDGAVGSRTIIRSVNGLVDTFA